MKKIVPMCKIGFIICAIGFCFSFACFAYCFENDKVIGMWVNAGVSIQLICLLLLNGIEMIIQRNKTIRKDELKNG